MEGEGPFEEITVQTLGTNRVCRCWTGTTHHWAVLVDIFVEHNVACKRVYMYSKQSIIVLKVSEKHVVRSPILRTAVAAIKQGSTLRWIVSPVARFKCRRIA